MIVTIYFDIILTINDLLLVWNSGYNVNSTMWLYSICFMFIQTGVFHTRAAREDFAKISYLNLSKTPKLLKAAQIY